jgi:hypothetical protein
MDRKLAILTLIDLIDLTLAADDDGWCPDLAERASGDPGPRSSGCGQITDHGQPGGAPGGGRVQVFMPVPPRGPRP